MPVEKETMRIDKDDILFPEGDKVFYSVSVIQKKILVVWSENINWSQSTLYALDELDYATN